MRRQSQSRRAGFSLIEVVISVAIMTTLTAVAIPVAGTIIEQGAIKATKAEMEQLAGAAEAHFVDTLQLPRDLTDLVSGDTFTGWAGPYLRGAFDDPISGAVGYGVDQWSQPYRFALSGNVWTIISNGPDGEKGGTDNIELSIDVTHLRRKETLDRLAVINQSILIYNAANLVTDPLPLNLNGILAKLVTSGLLPSSDRYAVDAWGDSFVEDPIGLAPVVRLNSIHLGPGAGSSGGSGSLSGFGSGASGSGGSSKSKDKGGKGGSGSKSGEGLGWGSGSKGKGKGK